MKIAIVGGGPAGLFFAKLMKREFPACDVTVFEQNPADATYGFGVVLTDTALRFLDEIAPDLHRDLVAASERQDAIAVVHRRTPVTIRGNVFYGIARVTLLGILQRHCAALGVRMEFGRRIADPLAFAGAYDLVVGADGVNSAVREAFADHFRAKKEPRLNKWAWYATPHPLGCVHIMVEQSRWGVFIGHGYRYAADRSGFVVECDPAAWQAAGLDQASDEESRAFCARLFGPWLDGVELISNRSAWFNPSFVTSEVWTRGNIVLIGDALKTVHPSIGSGTRVGMQDAIALYRALARHPGDVAEALCLYQRARKPVSDAFQDAAMRSIVWYETMAQRLHLDPVNFAFSYMMRTGRVNYERLRRMDRAFVDAYETTQVAFAAD